MAVLWNDNRPILLITNKDPVQPLSSCQRHLGDLPGNGKVSVPFPNTVVQYNRCIRGVDNMDRTIATCRINVGSHKWWWSATMQILLYTLNNAFYIFKRVHHARNKDCPFSEFIKQLAEQMLIKYGTPPLKKIVLHNKGPSPALGNLLHWPLLNPANKRYQCIHCKRRRIRYTCAACNVPLCIECGVPYHRL